MISLLCKAPTYSLTHYYSLTITHSLTHSLIYSFTVGGFIINTLTLFIDFDQRQLMRIVLVIAGIIPSLLHSFAHSPAHLIIVNIIFIVYVIKLHVQQIGKSYLVPDASVIVSEGTETTEVELTTSKGNLITHLYDALI